MSGQIIITSAVGNDVDEIINLYRIVYGKKYPISYGTEPKLLLNAINDKENYKVAVAKTHDGKIAGALIVEIEAYFKIGKLTGLVVHPDYQKLKIGQNIVSHVTDEVLEKSSGIHSVYATTRTLTVGPQVVFMKNGFIPLGIFPNAHRLHQYETVTLFAKFKKGLLEKRIPERPVSRTVMPLYKTLKGLIPEVKIPKVIDEPSITKKDFEHDMEFEIFQAPNYVLRKFKERFPSIEDRFFPFHSPNMIIADTKGKMEVFAYFSKHDGYCTIIKSTVPFHEINAKLTPLYLQLADIGVAYLEVLVNAKFDPLINYLLRGQFVPSAIYPAMREIDGKLEDYVVMSRTMEPLNFRGMAIIAPFKPYIDQYLETWKKVNIETIEVVYGE